MTSKALFTDPGANVKVYAAAGLEPQASLSDTDTDNGDAIEVKGRNGNPLYSGGILAVELGSDGGTVSARDLTAGVEVSADGSTGWTALTDEDGNDVEVTVTTADTADQVSFDLGPADRYIRATYLASVTGGGNIEGTVSLALIKSHNTP